MRTSDWAQVILLSLILFIAIARVYFRYSGQKIRKEMSLRHVEKQRMFWKAHDRQMEKIRNGRSHEVGEKLTYDNMWKELDPDEVEALRMWNGGSLQS